MIVRNLFAPVWLREIIYFQVSLHLFQSLYVRYIYLESNIVCRALFLLAMRVCAEY